MRKAYIVLLLLLFVLAACREQGGIEVVSGEVLSPEEQQSLYEAHTKQDEAPDVSVKGKVYWTKSGTKYHKDPNCSYLNNAKELQSGTAAEAANHGASGPCSRCGGKKQ